MRITVDEHSRRRSQLRLDETIVVVVEQNVTYQTGIVVEH